VNLQLSGLPALAIQIGFIVLFSAPVWLAAFIGSGVSVSDPGIVT
jgi:hypothetical protein